MEFHRRSIFSFVFLAALILLPSFVIAATFTRPLVVGSQGTDVSTLQQLLKDKGYFSGDITGYYGRVTSQAVASFQKASGIEAFGGVGPQTRTLLNSLSSETASAPFTGASGQTVSNADLINALLAHIKILQAKIAEIVAAKNGQATSSSGSTGVMITRPLALGAIGSDVTALQTFLQSSGYLTVAPTGYYGPATAAAVSAYQTANHLEAVGSVGPKTLAIINIAMMPSHQDGGNNGNGNSYGNNPPPPPPPSGGGGGSVNSTPSSGGTTSSGAPSSPSTSGGGGGGGSGGSATPPPPPAPDYGNSIFASYFNNSTLTIPSGESPSSASQVNVGNDTTISVGTTNGNDTIKLKGNSAVKKNASGPLDVTALSASDVDPASLTLPTGLAAEAVLQFGISGVELLFTQPVTIALNVGSANEGDTLNIYRSELAAGPWIQTGIVTPTCVVSGGLCTFDTTLASKFTATRSKPTVTIAANPTSVTSGGSTVVTWSSTNATSCTASGSWTGSKATSSTQTFTNLTANQTYTLTCTGKGKAGSAAQSASVTVTGAPADTTAPSAPASLAATAVSTSQVNLTWTASTDNVGVTGYRVFRNGGATAIASPTTNSYSDTSLAASTAYSYTVKAIDAAGNLSANSNTVSATTQSLPLPIVTLSANPTSVTSGNGSTLTWSSTNSTSCTASGAWSGTKAVSGTQSLTSLTTTGTYTLTCTGTGGSANKSVTIAVTAAADTTPPTVSITGPVSLLPAGTTQATLTATTDESSSCRYSTTSTFTFSSGTAFTTTGATSHSTVLSGLTNGTSYIYYVKCQDVALNTSNNATVNFAVASVVTPPPPPPPVTPPPPPPVSTQFIIGQQVTPVSTANVRQTAAGTLLGTQTAGVVATVIGGPTSAVLSGTTYVWWNLDFTSGVDGWVADDNLAASSVIPPPPPPVTPPPPPPPVGVNCTTGVWNNLESCGWSGPANTGPDLSQCPGGLTASGAMTITTAGTVVSCKNITGGINVNAQNVTIKNSKVSYDGGGAGGSGVISIDSGGSATVDHVEINGLNHTHACIWDSGVKGSALAYSMVAKNVNCYGVNDGIFSWSCPNAGTCTTNTGAGSDFIIQDSYLHDFTENAANGHIDGYQTEGAQNGTITHNTFKMARVANDVTVSGGGMDSAIAIWDDYNQPTPTGIIAGHFTVDNNLIQGGGFSMYAEDYSGPSGDAAENVTNSAVGGNSLIDVKFTNNKFSNVQGSCIGQYGTWFVRGNWAPYYGGPTDLWNVTGGSLRSGNIVLETGENIDRGGPTGCEGANTSPAAPSGGTTDTTAPSVPSGLTATVVSSSAINLSWTASTDNVGVTSYQIFRNGTQIGTPTTNSYSDTGLTAATAYSYTVKAADAAGNVSAASTAASATTLTAPASFSVGTRIQVSSGPLNVRATANTTGTLLGTQATGAFGTVTGGPTVQGGFTWWNINYDNGVDGWSAQDFLVAVSPIPTATLSASPTSITSGNSSTLTYSSTNATSCTGTNFTPTGTSGTKSVSPTSNTTYSITCTGTGGTSPAASATVTVTTASDTTAPSTPTNLSASAVSSSAINLAWTASTDNVGVTGYKIFRGGTQIGTSATNSYSDSGLSASTAYSYTVSAFDAAGNNSAQSSSASATTQAASTGGGACPKGTTYADGCSSAPTGTIQLPTLLSGYATRPSWNVAGVDYAVGPHSTPTKDPATISMTGVSLNTSSRTVNIDGNNVTLDGYDFSKGGGWQIAVSGNNATISNSFLDGHGLGQYKIYASGNTNITLSYDTFDGTDSTNDSDPLSMIRLTTSGTITLLYNYFHNIGDHALELTQGTETFSVVYKYNVWNQAALIAPSHENYLQFGGGTATLADVEFNTTYQTPQPSGGEGFQFYDNTNGGKINSSIGAYNTMIARSGATGSAMSYMIHGGNGAGTQSGLVGTLHDNYFDLTAAWGAFYGEEIGWTFNNNCDMVNGKVVASNNSESGTCSGSTGGGTTPPPPPPPPPPADTTPPTISITAPSGQLAAGTTQTTLSVTTNESATCAYSSTAGTAFASMTSFTTTGGTSHSTTLTGLTNGSSYTRYVKCKDTTGNISADSSLAFSVASTVTPPPPPPPVTPPPPPPTGGTTVTMGENTISGTVDSGNGNLLLVQSATLSQTATIQSLSFYAASASGNLRLGIYDATGAGGGPGALKAQTNSFAPVTGWNTQNVIAPVSLPVGNYWLAYFPSSDALSFSLASGGTYEYGSLTFGSMPATFPAIDGSGSAHWSLYGTLTSP